MKAPLKLKLAKEPSWFLGLAATLALLLGVAVVRLDAGRARTETLRINVERKLETLRSRNLAGNGEEELQDAEATLARWEGLATTPSARIEAISSAARRAGVTLLSLRENEVRTSEDGLVASYSHSLRGTGDYRQVALFLEVLQGRSGVVAIEDLEIEPLASSAPGRVEAVLRVSWLTARTPPPASPEEVPQ